MIVVALVYIKIGTEKNESIVNVTEVTSEKYFLRALPSFNAFSGCGRVHFMEFDFEKESG